MICRVQFDCVPRTSFFKGIPMFLGSLRRMSSMTVLAGCLLSLLMFGTANRDSLCQACSLNWICLNLTAIWDYVMVTDWPQTASWNFLLPRVRCCSWTNVWRCGLQLPQDGRPPRQEWGRSVCIKRLKSCVLIGRLLQELTAIWWWSGGTLSTDARHWDCRRLINTNAIMVMAATCGIFAKAPIF